MKKIGREADSGRHTLIIPIFLMNSGCPHRCVFCNQKISAGHYPETITKDYFDAQVESYLAWNKDKSRDADIAFYGGSFTAMNSAYREELLCWANRFIGKGLVRSIRISTRPDCIVDDDMTVLKKHNVSTIEIGAESFVDDVLLAARRGHAAADIDAAAATVKKYGFACGLHLMAGLPGDTAEGFDYSLHKTIELRPDTVRIHPVLVFNETLLAEEFRGGRYKPLSLTEAVALCRRAWEKLSVAGIRVVRMGVQATPEMRQSGSIVAGPFHPAFGSLVLSSVFYHHTLDLLKSVSTGAKTIHFALSKQDESDFRGLNNQNIREIKSLYPDVNLIIESAPDRARGKICVTTDTGESLNVNIPGIF